MAPGKCLKITVQNRERILDAVENVALETVREALLQHRHTTKHIMHGSVRPLSQRPRRKVSRLDARFSSLSVPSMTNEEQESPKSGDMDQSLWAAGMICDTVSMPYRKLSKLEYIKNIVGFQNLPTLDCGQGGQTLQDMVSQSDRSQCQDSTVRVPSVCVGSLRSADQSRCMTEESTVTEDRSSLQATDQGERISSLSESSGLRGNSKEIVTGSQIESPPESALVTGVDATEQDFVRMTITDTQTDHGSSSSDVVPAYNGTKTAENSVTDAPEINIVKGVANRIHENRQLSLAMPNLEVNVLSIQRVPSGNEEHTDMGSQHVDVVSKTISPRQKERAIDVITRKDGNIDAKLSQESVISVLTVTTRKNGNTDARLSQESVISIPTITTRKGGNTDARLSQKSVIFIPTVTTRKDGNIDARLSQESVISIPTVTTRKDGNTDVRLSHKSVISIPTVTTRKDRKTDARLSHKSVISIPTVTTRKDGNTDARLSYKSVISIPTVTISKEGNTDAKLSHESKVSKFTIHKRKEENMEPKHSTPRRKDANPCVSLPRDKFGRKDARKETGVNVTKSRDSLNGLEEIRSSILAELEQLCQSHASDDLVTHQPSNVVRGGNEQVTPAKVQSKPTRNQTKDNSPETVTKKNTTTNVVKKQENMHTTRKKTNEACVVVQPKKRASDNTTTSEMVKTKVAQKHKSEMAEGKSGCIPQKRCRMTAPSKRFMIANNPRTVTPVSGCKNTKPNKDSDYVYFQFGGEECIHRNPFCDRSETKSELLLRLELLDGEIKRHELLVKLSDAAEDGVFLRKRLILQLEVELLQSWLLYQGVGQLLFPGHPLPAALQLSSDGKKTVTDNQRVMLLDRVPTVDEYGKLYDLRQTLETSRKLHKLGVKGHSDDNTKPKMRQRQSMLATLLSLPSKAKLQQLQQQLANYDDLREQIWSDEDGRKGTTLILEYLDVRCCGLEIHIKAIEGILDDDDVVIPGDASTSGDRHHMTTLRSDQQLKSTSESDQQHKSTSGDQQLKSTSESDQQHKSMSDGDQQHKSTSGDQQDKSTSECDQQHKSMSDGDQLHKSTPGDQQLKSTSEGDQHKSTSDGDQHKSTSDGDQQHTSENVEAGAHKSIETTAHAISTANNDITSSTTEVGNSNVFVSVSAYNGDMSTQNCNSKCRSDDNCDAFESGVHSATSKSHDDSDYVECDMDMSKSSDQSDHIICGTTLSPEVSSHVSDHMVCGAILSPEVSSHMSDHMVCGTTLSPEVSSHVSDHMVCGTTLSPEVSSHVSDHMACGAILSPEVSSHVSDHMVCGTTLSPEVSSHVSDHMACGAILSPEVSSHVSNHMVCGTTLLPEVRSHVSDHMACGAILSPEVSSHVSDHMICGAVLSPEVISHVTYGLDSTTPTFPATLACDLDSAINATAISVITNTMQMCSEIPVWPGQEVGYVDNWCYEDPGTNASSGYYTDSSSGVYAENNWGLIQQSSVPSGDDMANYQMNTPVPPLQTQSQPAMPAGQLYCWLVQQMSANPYLWQNAPASLQNYLLQPASFSEPAANAQWAQWLLANWQFQMGFAVPPQ